MVIHIKAYTNSEDNLTTLFLYSDPPLNVTEAVDFDRRISEVLSGIVEVPAVYRSKQIELQALRSYYEAHVREVRSYSNVGSVLVLEDSPKGATGIIKLAMASEAVFLTEQFRKREQLDKALGINHDIPFTINDKQWQARAEKTTAGGFERGRPHRYNRKDRLDPYTDKDRRKNRVRIDPNEES